MRYDEKGFASWTVLFLDEQKPFWRDVVGAGVHVLNKSRVEGLGDVVNHHPSGSLQPNERIGAVEGFTEDYALRLRAFVVASRVESRGRAVGIEQGWNLRRGDLLEVIAAVKYELPLGRPDGEGARPRHENFVEVAIAISVASCPRNRQPAEISIQLEYVRVWENFRIEGQSAYLRFFVKAREGAAIALIDHHEIGHLANLIRLDRIWLVHAKDWPFGNVNSPHLR